MYIICSILVTLFIIVVKSQNCPIDECSCETRQNTVGRIINCRDKSLTQIPLISYSSEVFYELTFSTSQNPTSCSTCNKITSIPDDAFSNITVKRLDLSKNFIGQYSERAFNGLEGNLKELLLYGDTSREPPYMAMTTLSQLTLLHLENFNQHSIETVNTYGDYPNLETLILKSMSLSYIVGTAFVNKLTKLKRLEIVNNPQLLTIPVGALRQLVTLEHLSLIQDGLTRVYSNAFEMLTHLIELDLQHNGIVTLDNGWSVGIQQNLEYIGLHLNNLNETQLNTFNQGTWSKLQQLNLAHNRITNIPNGLFGNMPELAYLNLDSNHLTIIRNTNFQTLRNLHELDLATNQIASIEPGSFENSPHLKILDITYQNLPNIKLNLTSQAVQGLGSTLTELRVSNTRLEESTIWDAIKSLVSLHVLKVSETNLINIQDFVFSNHIHLKYLELRGPLNGNGFMQVSQRTFHGLKDSLETLDLSHNSIQTIDECALKSFLLLRNLDLTSNPFQCDCALTWLYDWIHQKMNSDPLFIPMLVQAVCATPSNLANKELYTLTRTEFCNTIPSPLTCENYTATTAAPTTKTISTTPSLTTTATVAVPKLTLSVISGSNFVKLTWSVEGDKNIIARYTVTYQRLGVDSSKRTLSVDRDLTEFEIKALASGSEYEVCIYIIFTNLPSDQIKCTVARTTEVTTKAPPTTAEGLHPGIIGGIVAGVVIVIVIIIVFLYILIKTNRRQKAPYPPQPVVEPRSFAPVGTPRPGYDSKRFSKPKKNVEQNGKQDLQVKVISTGKTDEERNRVSAGSYHYLNENQRLSQDPKPSTSKMSGANGTSYDVKPTRQSGGRYANDPTTQPPPYTAYANEPASFSQDHYVNNLDSRPLPKKPKSYENNSSGFLNHGFSPESSDHHYHEIKDTMI